MAPFYVGLVISLAVAALRFIAILYEFTIEAWTETEAALIVDVLALIDVSWAISSSSLYCLAM